MKPGSTYPTNQAIKLLLGGDPGTGKTVTSMAFPSPWFADCDGNLRSAVRFHEGKSFTWDSPEYEYDDAGNVVRTHPEQDHWLRLEKLIKEAGPKPEVGTIVIDGLGRVTDYLKAYLVHVGSAAEKPLMIGGMKVMSKSLWEGYEQALKKLVFLCGSFGKPFILTCHFKVVENELSPVMEQKVNLQGKLVADFPKCFTDFWACHTAQSADARYKNSNGVRYYIRTAPTNRMQLKQSCGLPAEFELGDAPFRELLAKISTPPTISQPA